MPIAHQHIHSGHMHIHEWPSAERPREKLLAHGAATLSDAELLAIFLGSGLRGRDAVQTSRELLVEHGPLRRLLDQPATALSKLPGLGPARACKLAAALELGQRHLAAELERGATLSDPQAAGRYFTQRLRAKPQEVFAALFLDTRHRALAFEELFTGTIDGAEIHPREVVRRALMHNAAAVIVSLPITFELNDTARSLVLLHFRTSCTCHQKNSHPGDKLNYFATTAKAARLTVVLSQYIPINGLYAFWGGSISLRPGSGPALPQAG